MNYKLQVHFLNDVTTWRAHVPTLITMDIINSPFLHQCRLHSNGNGFKIDQKSFIQSSSNLQEANHLDFSCQQYRLLVLQYLKLINSCPIKTRIIIKNQLITPSSLSLSSSTSSTNHSLHSSMSFNRIRSISSLISYF